MTTTAFILKLRNYQQTPKEIMTNKFKNKNGNHINTGATFNLFTTWLIYWHGVGKNGSLLHHFLHKILFNKKVLLLPYAFYLLYKFNNCFHSPSPWLICWGKQIFKNAAWSRLSNFLEPGGDDENLRRNTDWEAQVQTLRVNFVTCESISK